MRYAQLKFSLRSELFNLLVLKGEWKLLSENKEFMDCAVETGNIHIQEGILSANIVNNSLKSVNRLCKLQLSKATLSVKKC